MSRRWIAVLGALSALLVAGSGLAATPKSSIKITGPTSIKKFHVLKLKVSFVVESPANKWAVFTDTNPCLKKELAELNRGSSFEADQGFPLLGKHVTVTVNVNSGKVGTHYACGYVFLRQNKSNDPHTTYARASFKWTSHH